MTATVEAFICHECKDQLVQFHIFKRNVKQYKDFQAQIRLLEKFLKLETVLETFEFLSDIHPVKYSANELLLASQMQHNRFERFLEIQPNFALHKIEFVEDDAVEESDQQRDCESVPVKSRRKRKVEIRPELEAEAFAVSNAQKVEEISKLVDATDSSGWNETQSHQPRWNTNSSLTEEQKLWIQDNARGSGVTVGETTSWKCSLCSSKMRSEWVLRKHLRDVHIINPSKPSNDKKRGKEFMDEVRACKGFTQDSNEPVWKCSRCDKIHKSESGFIKHLLYSHINNASISPSFVARCKIQIEYDDHRPMEIGWSCPECKKFYRSPVGLKNHLKLSHRDVDFGGESYERKVKEATERSMVLKEEEKQSEIVLETDGGSKKIWQCSRCSEPRFFRSESGFKTHVRRLHLQMRQIDERKVAACLVIVDGSLPKQKVWKCSACSAVLKTKDGFISHVTQDHPGEFDAGERSNEADLKLTSSIDEEVLHKLTEQVERKRGGALKVDGYKFSCNECGLYFRKHYPTHVEAHKTFKELASNYQLQHCEQCRIIYSHDEAMLKHLEWHAEETETICAYPSRGLAFLGGKEFKEPSGSADDAVDENVWKCGHCFASFWEADECVEHQMLMHIETLVCPIDHLQFTGNRGLTQFCSHMKNKHPELFPNLTYSCTYCNKPLGNIFEKHAHMKVCDEKKLECDGCGRKFFNKIKLAHHLKIERGLLSYKCNVCGKKCTNSMDLKLHTIGTHTNSRMYACTYEDCYKTFKTSASRSSHMETHSKVEHQCSFCERIFKKRVVLATHVKMMHDDGYR